MFDEFEFRPVPETENNMEDYQGFMEDEDLMLFQNDFTDPSERELYSQLTMKSILLISTIESEHLLQLESHYHRLEQQGQQHSGNHEREKLKSLIVCQFLLENFEEQPNAILSRVLFYKYFTKYCESVPMEATSLPTLGKIIKHLFPNVRARRLGSRDHSKYHYHGLGFKNQVLDNGQRKREIQWPSPMFQISSKEEEDFFESFNEYLTNLIPLFLDLNMEGIINRWKSYWSQVSGYEKKLLLRQDFVIYLTQNTALFYDFLMEEMIEDVLEPMNQHKLCQTRQLAKCLESSFTDILKDCPQPFLQSQKKLLRIFVVQLKRQTGLNHLAMTIGQILNNQELISTFMEDWLNLDFTTIHEQLNWVLECPFSTLEKFEEEFKILLNQLLQKKSDNKENLNHFCTWLKSMTKYFLSASPLEEEQSIVQSKQTIIPNTLQLKVQKQGKELLWKFDLYTSFIIRDLTLKSAPSFGTVHALKIFSMEFLFYLVEQRVVEAELDFSILSKQHYKRTV